MTVTNREATTLWAKNTNLAEVENFVELLNLRALLEPDATAFVFFNSPESKVELTLAELNKYVRAIAMELQKHHTVGESALLLYRPGIEFIAAFLGCLYAKVIPVPVHPVRNPREISRLQGIVEDANPHFVLTTSQWLDHFQKIYQTLPLASNVTWLSTDEISLEASGDWTSPTIKSSDVAFLQYTSGSTGQPKGVMVTHGNLLHNQQTIKEGFQHSKDTVVVGWLPLYHDMGLIGNVLQSLYLGIKAVLFTPTMFLRSPVTWLRNISQYKATTSGGPNFAYEMCVRKITDEQMKDVDLSSWQIAFNGAEPVKADVLQKFTAKFQKYGFKPEAFYPCYGMAETTLFVAGGNPQEKPFLLGVDEQELENNRLKVVESNPTKMLVGCGKIYGGQTVYIVNPETHSRCQPDEIGEIWISGDSVAAGYRNQPQKTKDTFQAYLTTGEGPFLRTGDLGCLKDEELFITGRIKDLIIIRGRNHYPHDIENTVENSHPSIRLGGTVALEIENKLIVVSEIQKAMVKTLDYKDLLTTIRKNISDLHGLRLHDLVLIASGTLAKTSSGKPRRLYCKSLYHEDGFRKVVNK